MTQVLSLYSRQGQTETVAIVWKAEGTPVDLTGWTARFQVRETATADPALLDLGTTAGGIALGGVAGTIAIHFSAAATRAVIPNSRRPTILSAGTIWRDVGVYGLTLIGPEAQVVRLLEGSFFMDAEIVR